MTFQAFDRKFYGFCKRCARQVEGKEKPKLGNPSQIIIEFNCPCGSSWFKDKRHLVAAIKGGYRNSRNGWVPCDEQGKPVKQQPEEIRPSRLEDQILFDSLTHKLEVNGNDFRRLRLKEIIDASHERDVSSDICRWFGYSVDSVFHEVRMRGYKAEALNWLKSTYGSACREERIARAREYAEKVGISPEEIAKENNIEI